MDGTEIGLRVVGAFYVFAGRVAARAALTSNLIDRGDERPDDTYDDSALDHTGLPASANRIKLMADYGTYPLWAMDDGLIGDFSPQELGVSEELTADLWAWANDFDLSLNPDDPANSHWSDDRHKQHVTDGLALARRIKRALPDRDVFAHDTSGNLIEVTADGGGAGV